MCYACCAAASSRNGATSISGDDLARQVDPDIDAKRAMAEQLAWGNAGSQTASTAVADDKVPSSTKVRAWLGVQEVYLCTGTTEGSSLKNPCCYSGWTRPAMLVLQSSATAAYSTLPSTLPGGFLSSHCCLVAWFLNGASTVCGSV